MLPFTLVSCNVKYNQTIYFPLFCFSPKYPIFDEMQFYSIPYLINYSYEITLYMYFKLRENRETFEFYILKKSQFNNKRLRGQELQREIFTLKLPAY